MSEVKLFEVLDRATFIPVIAIRLSAKTDADKYLMGRSAFLSRTFTLMGRLAGGELQYDPNRWADRTFQTAHAHIEENWLTLESGEVIDIEFILGETDHPKETERFANLCDNES